MTTKGTDLALESDTLNCQESIMKWPSQERMVRMSQSADRCRIGSIDITWPPLDTMETRLRLDVASPLSMN